MTASQSQKQTASTFGYEWHQIEAFDTPAQRKMTREWLIERYGDIENATWWAEYGERPRVLDVGCGAGLTAIEMFGSRLTKIDYLGIDISEAYKVAAERFQKYGLPGRHRQADMTDNDLPKSSFDVILAEGTLHHTDSTENALHYVSGLLAPGGRFMFYVYRKKGPIREFSDDYIRAKLTDMSPEEAWRAMIPLTKLGIALGALNIEVDVPEKIDLLEIPAGKINLQRLFYWHVFKAFYRPEMTLEEMNHTNFDWYAPANAHRQTLSEVTSWSASCNLVMERIVEQESGITIIAKKTG